MIVVVGESASGKTTLVNNFIENNPQYHKIVSYTTRPMRKGEKNGKDYHFINQTAFDKFVEKGFFIEHATYRGWSYGVAKEDCKTSDTVAILTPAGLRTLKRYDIEVKSIYLYVDRRSRMINIICRGDDIDEAYRRNLSDVGQFDGISNEVDFIIDNTKYHMNENQVLNCFEKIINGSVSDLEDYVK